MPSSFVTRFLSALFGSRRAPAATPREPVESNVDTARWFDAPTETPSDAERYRSAPPLGRDTIDSDPGVRRWYRRPRYVVHGAAEHRTNKIAGA